MLSTLFSVKRSETIVLDDTLRELPIGEMSVTVTEKAAKEVMRFIEEGEYDEGACLRSSVSGGGCSGFNYGLNIAEKRLVS